MLQGNRYDYYDTLFLSMVTIAFQGSYILHFDLNILLRSPFAVLGSIGVISEQPNVYERLKKEGIGKCVCTFEKWHSRHCHSSTSAWKNMTTSLGLSCYYLISADISVLDLSKFTEFQTVTAGKYKRTLTPFKKATKDDFEKSKSDVEDILTLFKGFVKKNRPKLDIDLVATGKCFTLLDFATFPDMNYSH